MGFLSRIVADARAHAPMVRATARAVERTQAAAEGSEVVGSPTDQATASLHRQMDQMADLIRRTGIKL